MVTTEDKILRAATDVFAKRGVTGATTREIARCARVNEVTLFRLFRNKDELLRRVVMQSSWRFDKVFAAPSPTSALDLKRTVEQYATVYAQKLVENEEFVRTFLGEMSRHPQLCRRLFSDGAQSVRQQFISYLRAARRKRLVRSNLDVTMAADALSAMLLGGFMRRPLTAGEYDLNDYVKTCVKLYLRGIQP
jgi:AcrR family transcriptional regulator